LLDLSLGTVADQVRDYINPSLSKHIATYPRAGACVNHCFVQCRKAYIAGVARGGPGFTVARG
jgi:hypothetical protein